MRLVADANVLLAAVLGGKAKSILQHPAIQEILTPEVTFAEVQEYAAILAKQKQLPLDTLLLTVATLPVSIVEKSVYGSKLSEARRRIVQRDPDDVDVLALTLHANIPLWSNDNDFEDTGVEWYTTAELLQKLSALRRSK